MLRTIANVMGFMNRLNGLFTSFAFLLVNTIIKFKSGQNPGPTAGSGLTVFPLALMLISFGFSFFINFNQNKLALVKQSAD